MYIPRTNSISDCFLIVWQEVSQSNIQMGTAPYLYRFLTILIFFNDVYCFLNFPENKIAMAVVCL